uniref:Uncharacterized protein n=1 Tax=Plectus sambesii TaxID=2011161 RepID=A0A914X806_9BILA
MLAEPDHSNGRSAKLGTRTTKRRPHTDRGDLTAAIGRRLLAEHSRKIAPAVDPRESIGPDLLPLGYRRRALCGERRLLYPPQRALRSGFLTTELPCVGQVTADRGRQLSFIKDLHRKTQKAEPATERDKC